MTREVARRLVFLFLRATSAPGTIVVAGMVAPGCYSGGGAGTDPPTTTFYFPVGLAVSKGGNALYAVNSDFDLQWSGGTLQSYDLFSIRRDTAVLINSNLSHQSAATAAAAAGIQFIYPPATTACAVGGVGAQAQGAPPLNNSDGSRVGLGEACAPPVDTTKYVRGSAVIGAFATDLQLQSTEGVHYPYPAIVGHRLFAPVRGDATLTWADVKEDDATRAPTTLSGDREPGVTAQTMSLPNDFFALDCGQSTTGTPACSADHRTGDNPSAQGDTRQATLPGEPFGMAQTPDGTAIAITHQTQTLTSLLLAGSPDPPAMDPSMQFVADDIDNAGKGIVAVPHDPDASVKPCEIPKVTAPCVNPAFLETSGATAELDLLRYSNDDGSTLRRPFVSKERVFPFATNLSGTDSRGIAIDPTPRAACKARVRALAPAPAVLDHQIQLCGELPARVFFANRTPSTLVLATIGGPSPITGAYDPDQVTFGTSNIPLPPGPSRVYVAPIANLAHSYELRVFVVNFNSSTISVYNPNANDPNVALVDTIFVGPGPFAMAFDPFSLDDVAVQAPIAPDARYDPSLHLSTYRFAYVASFTQSYVQVIDLDQSKPTFESVVFTLGNPTPPKGT